MSIDSVRRLNVSISTDSYSIGRVEGVFVGAVGATKAASTDLGSVVGASFANSFDLAEATSAKLRGAVMAQEPQNARATFRLNGVEQQTAFNIALAMGGTVSGNRILIGPPTAMSYKTVYVDGFDYEAGLGTLHVKKAALASGTEIAIGSGEQTKYDLEFNVMAKTDEPAGEEWAAFDPYTADTTAPTVSSTTPTDAATNVAVTSTVVWNFSEAVRTMDVNAQNFYLIKADGTAVATTLAVSNSDQRVTLTPSSNLSAATAYIAVCNYVRDVAGNALEARSIVNFTTA
jgi:hypothetical protein